MATFLNTRGRSRLSIAICARCSRKMPWSELRPDPNSPGLMVCREDRDQFDPWRLPPRQTEQISLPWARPDTPLVPGPWDVPVLPIQVAIGVGQNAIQGGNDGTGIAAGGPGSVIQQPTPWAARASYIIGAMVTPAVAVGPAVAGQTIYQYQCLIGGQSGVTAPAWPENQGAMVVDGGVVWSNQGLYLP